MLTVCYTLSSELYHYLSKVILSLNGISILSRKLLSFLLYLPTLYLLTLVPTYPTISQSF